MKLLNLMKKLLQCSPDTADSETSEMMSIKLKKYYIP